VIEPQLVKQCRENFRSNYSRSNSNVKLRRPWLLLESHYIRMLVVPKR